MPKCGWVHHSTGSRGVFPISIPQSRPAPQGCPWPQGNLQKQLKGHLEAREKRKEKRKEENLSCEDAERTKVAHLTEGMNGGCLITAQKVQNQRDKSR